MNNIVLVNQSGSKYLFSVPESIQLKEGDNVKCDTRRGITDGVCFTDSVTINASALPLVCKLTGATLPLKEIVGKVVTSVEMFNKPVEKPSQPIAPQEDKARFEVGQKVKVIGNCCCHGYSRGTILTLVRSVNFLRREPDWYVGEGTDYVSERDIEPYAEPEKEPEPVYLNMKVVCTDGDSSFYAGKVYEFINGKVKDKDGDERPQPLNPTSGRASNFEQFYKAYCGEAKFIPYLGEA